MSHESLVKEIMAYKNRFPDVAAADNYNPSAECKRFLKKMQASAHDRSFLDLIFKLRKEPWQKQHNRTVEDVFQVGKYPECLKPLSHGPGF